MAHATPAPVRFIDTSAAGRWATVVDAFLAGYSSAKTRATYRQGLKPWMQWCAMLDVDPGDVRRTHVELYMRHLEDRGLAPATRGVRLTAVKSFYGWCYDEELVDGNPAGRVKAPHIPKQLTTAMDRHEATRFLMAVRELGLEQTALLTTMLMVGTRVGETCKANVGDIVKDRYFYLLHVRGKGERERDVLLPQMAIGAIHEALDARDGEVSPDDPLFLSPTGLRAYRRYVATSISRAAAAAGIDKRITPHSLRRSAVSIALDEGKPLREVQKMVGHASVDTTIRYDRRELNPARSPAFAIQAAVS